MRRSAGGGGTRFVSNMTTIAHYYCLQCFEVSLHSVRLQPTTEIRCLLCDQAGLRTSHSLRTLKYRESSQRTTGFIHFGTRTVLPFISPIRLYRSDNGVPGRRLSAYSGHRSDTVQRWFDM